MAQMAAQLNQANFTQAQAGATGDISRDLAAQTSNQGANQAKINSDILASQGLSNTGDALNKANIANWTMLQTSGADQQQQQQNQINAQMSKFNNAWNYPTQQLNTLLSALGMSPKDTATSGSGTSQSTTQSTPNWAELGTDLFGTAMKVFGPTGSDKKLKKDVTSLGADPVTGVPIKSTIATRASRRPRLKIVGPMAAGSSRAAAPWLDRQAERRHGCSTWNTSSRRRDKPSRSPAEPPTFPLRQGWSAAPEPSPCLGLARGASAGRWRTRSGERRGQA